MSGESTTVLQPWQQSVIPSQKKQKKKGKIQHEKNEKAIKQTKKQTLKKHNKRLGAVALAYNPSNSGGRLY